MKKYNKILINKYKIIINIIKIKIIIVILIKKKFKKIKSYLNNNKFNNKIIS